MSKIVGPIPLIMSVYFQNSARMRGYFGLLTETLEVSLKNLTSLYVCDYKCMYVCMYVCVYVWLYVCLVLSCVYV